MRKKNPAPRLMHAGESTMTKRASASVSVPKTLPTYMCFVFSFDGAAPLDAVYGGVYDYLKNELPCPAAINVSLHTLSPMKRPLISLRNQQPFHFVPAVL